MNRESALRGVLSGLLATLSVAVAGVAGWLVVVVDTANVAAVGMALLAAGFFAASALPRVRNHEAFGLLSAAYALAMIGFWGLTVGPEPSALPLALGVAAAGWVAVELFRRRRAGRPSAT